MCAGETQRESTPATAMEEGVHGGIAASHKIMNRERLDVRASDRSLEQQFIVEEDR